MRVYLWTPCKSAFRSSLESTLFYSSVVIFTLRCVIKSYVWHIVTYPNLIFKILRGKVSWLGNEVLVLLCLPRYSSNSNGDLCSITVVKQLNVESWLRMLLCLPKHFVKIYISATILLQPTSKSMLNSKSSYIHIILKLWHYNTCIAWQVCNSMTLKHCLKLWYYNTV